MGLIKKWLLNGSILITFFAHRNKNPTFEILENNNKNTIENIRYSECVKYDKDMRKKIELKLETIEIPVKRITKQISYVKKQKRLPIGKSLSHLKNQIEIEVKVDLVSLIQKYSSKKSEYPINWTTKIIYNSKNEP